MPAIGEMWRVPGGMIHITRSMRWLLFSLIAATVAIGAFVVGLRRPEPAQTDRGAPAPAPFPEDGATPSAARDGSERDPDDSAKRTALRRIAESDTYLPAILEERDSMLIRWRDRLADPLRVHFEEPVLAGYTPAMGRAVRDAFARWRRVAGIPVEFAYVRNPEDAEVSVRWVRSFAMRREGQADVTWRSDGWITRATLTLATHTVGDRTLTTEAVFTVAVHEIGHLLGIGHSDRPADVMYPSTGIQALTIRDRRTAMLLYGLPPGSYKLRP